MIARKKLPDKNAEVDPEHLQALDETNEKWVTEWNKAVKQKTKTKQ